MKKIMGGLARNLWGHWGTSKGKLKPYYGGISIMVFTQIIRWHGRRIGWVLQEAWDGVKAAIKLIGLLLIIIIGTILAFIGQLILLFLGLLVTLCIGFLKGFAYITQYLMITTKLFGEKLSEWTEAFYEGVGDMFRAQEDILDSEIKLIIKADRL